MKKKQRELFDDRLDEPCILSEVKGCALYGQAKRAGIIARPPRDDERRCPFCFARCKPRVEGPGVAR